MGRGVTRLEFGWGGVMDLAGCLQEPMSLPCLQMELSWLRFYFDDELSDSIFSLSMNSDLFCFLLINHWLLWDFELLAPSESTVPTQAQRVGSIYAYVGLLARWINKVHLAPNDHLRHRGSWMTRQKGHPFRNNASNANRLRGIRFHRTALKAILGNTENKNWSISQVYVPQDLPGWGLLCSCQI